MPFKLIGTLILVVLVAVLTGFNLDNRCDIWLFYTFKNVPSVVTILISFCLGVLVTLPFTIGKKKSRKEDLKNDKKADKEYRKALKKNKKSEKDYNSSDSEAAEAKPVVVPTVSDADASPSSFRTDGDGEVN